MSTELKANESMTTGNIQNTSFSGGVTRGQCFQMNQMNQMHRTRHDVHTIQLTKEQVVEQIAIMAAWLGE